MSVIKKVRNAWQSGSYRSSRRYLCLGEVSRRTPNIYHIQIMQFFCAFVRDQTAEKKRLDFDAVMRAISARSHEQRDLEKEKGHQLNLDEVDFSGLNLYNLDLSEISFAKANLSNAFLVGTNLSNARFYGASLSKVTLASADLSGASLENADLSSMKNAIHADFSNANLEEANLSKARLYGATFDGVSLLRADVSGAYFRRGKLLVKGLTQKQLNMARARPNDPPVLEGLLDTETSQPIVWREQEPYPHG